MSERGLPIVDGAPACPFVAFDDDRDERAARPDHRHRCYAEAEPATRALAHQEAYCLSSAFPVCPTFQDWARREAARSRGETGRSTDASAAAPLPGGPQRNPPRNWAAPPPWLSRDERAARAAGGLWDDDGDEDEPEAPKDEGRPDVPRRSRGLSGSYADRVLADQPAPSYDVSPGPEPPASSPPVPVTAEAMPEPRRRRERDPLPGSAPSPERRPDRGPSPAPEWERVKPLEAYPTLRSRRLGELSVPPILVAVIALAIAVAVVFALPGLLGFGSPQAGSSPSPSTPIRTPLPSLAPTPVPQPTPQSYVVQSGDTMSKIAGRFGVTLAELIAANAQTVPNPNVLQVGQVLLIPITVPTELPASEQPSPS